MAQKQSYPVRNYAVGQLVLNLRSRAQLTQAGLAARLGVHRRSVQKWESGETFPSAENLRALIAVLLTAGAFRPGQEQDDAADLWQQVSEAAPQPLPFFDAAWFLQLLPAGAAAAAGDQTLAPQSSAAANAAPSPLPSQPQQIQRGEQSIRPGLPFQATPLIGRGAELSQLDKLLTDPACRLITLLGPGGIGKTRLALAAAAAQAEAYRDGVAFVALASVSAPNQIALAIGDALQLSFAEQPDASTYLLESLRERQMLLLLDDFEHLLDGADLVSDMLQTAPQITILVTSRARLNLQAEWLFEVNGLAYPPSDWPGENMPRSQQELADYGAVQLFVQRATQVQPQLSLSNVSLKAIGHICQHVAGMPLAIELAAANVRTLPITEVERQIRLNLDSLATNMRDVPARHRSLRAVFDQSWNMLHEPERAVLSRLAIFRGGWDEVAVEAICAQVTTQPGNGEHGEDALPLPYPVSSDLLAALIDKSLLRRSYDAPGAGEADRQLKATETPRYVLLEPIREYALEQLVARGEAEVLQQAHANYYLTLAEAITAQGDGPAAELASERLEREYDNMRAVLQWACDEGNLTIGLQLAGGLAWYWRRRGYLSEGRAWLEELLALADLKPEPGAATARLRAMEGAAWLATHQHDYGRARQLFEQSVTLRRALGETTGETNLLSNAALEARAAGQYQPARALLEDALARHQALGNRGSLSSGGLGLSLFFLALVCREQGDFERAVTLFEASIALHRELGDREGLALGLLGLSDVARDQGDITQIQAYGGESLAALRELEVQWAIGFALNNLALAAYQAGDLSQAAVLSSESVGLFRAQEADGSLAEVLITLGQVKLAQRELVPAYQALTEALRFAWAVGPRLMVAAALEGLAGVVVVQGQATLAVRLLAAAAMLRAQMETPVRPTDQPQLDHTLAVARAALGIDAFAREWAKAETVAVDRILSYIPSLALFSAAAEAPEVQPDSIALMPDDSGHVDWGLAQEVPALYGRAGELASLSQWGLVEKCRIISLVGIGGIGKTSLAVAFARQVTTDFDAVIFRSLGEAPPLPELLNQLIYSVAEPQVVAPASLSDKLALLIDLLRQTRCLIILDNLETLMQAGTAEIHYLAGYEGYGTLLKAVGDTAHQSCLILTSREQPPELAPLAGPQGPVRTMRLAGLSEEAGRALLAGQALSGAAGDIAELARRLDGNPLALKLAAAPIRALFGGDIAAFLAEGSLFFDGVGQLLAQQINRASALEQALLVWLAIEREPVTLDQLMVNLSGTAAASRAVVLAALHALWRRNLVERGQANLTFSLQRVVLEYLTEHLVERTGDEIRRGDFDYLCHHALIQATAREYVRRSQELLIAAPLLEQLAGVYGGPEAVEQRLLSLLANWRALAPGEQGYGPGNVINLLRLQRGQLSGLDLSQLLVRQANLQGVQLQDTNLAGARLQDSIFTEAFDALTAVAVSNAGDYWAAASRRGEVLVWATGGLTLHRMWRAHTDMIWTLAFSPDGLLLASGSWDGRVKVWDVASGALRWAGWHTSHANWVAFAPDGSMLASSGNDATVRLWDSQSGRQLQTLPHPGPVSGIAWSPSGHLIASGDLEGGIRLWAVNKHEPANLVQELAGHPKKIDGLAFDPEGYTLASASWDGTLKLWAIPGGTLRQTLTGHSDRLVRVTWSADGGTLASCSRDQTIWLWDIKQGGPRMVLQGHSAGVDGMAITPDSRSLVSGSEDGTLRVWDIGSGQCRRIVQGYATSLYDVDWSPDGRQLISGGSDYLVTIYAVSGETPPRVLRGHGGVVLGVGWSSVGRWLASSEWDNIIRLWDAASGESLAVLQHPDDSSNYFYGLAWSPDGQRLAGATYKRGIQVFDMTGQKPLWAGREFPTWIRHVAWRPDGGQVAGGGDDGMVYIWHGVDGKLLQGLEGHHSMITSVAWSPSGRRLASSGRGKQGGDLFVWDARRGERIQAVTEHPRMVYAVAWGTNENQVISGGGDGKLRWWEVQSGQCVQEREAHQGTVQSLRRSPDGTKLASCGDDGAIMLWDLASGEPLQTLRRDRPYERLNISGIKGLTEGQRNALRALGAVG